MSCYHQTPITVSIHLKGDNPIFGDSTTHIRLEDEAGGAFVVLKQCNDNVKSGETCFDIEELELVAKVARELVEEYNKAKLPAAVFDSGS